MTMGWVVTLMVMEAIVFVVLIVRIGLTVRRSKETGHRILRTMEDQFLSLLPDEERTDPDLEVALYRLRVILDDRTTRYLPPSFYPGARAYALTADRFACEYSPTWVMNLLRTSPYGWYVLDRTGGHHYVVLDDWLVASNHNYALWHHDPSTRRWSHTMLARGTG